MGDKTNPPKYPVTDEELQPELPLPDQDPDLDAVLAAPPPDDLDTGGTLAPDEEA